MTPKLSENQMSELNETLKMKVDQGSVLVIMLLGPPHLKKLQLIMYGSMTKLQRLALSFIQIGNFFAYQRNMQSGTLKMQISAIKIISKPKGFLLEYFRLVVLAPRILLLVLKLILLPNHLTICSGIY